MEKAPNNGRKTIAKGPVSVKCEGCGKVIVLQAKAERETVQKPTKGVYKNSMTAEIVTTLEAMGTFGAPPAAPTPPA